MEDDGVVAGGDGADGAGVDEPFGLGAGGGADHVGCGGQGPEAFVAHGGSGGEGDVAGLADLTGRGVDEPGAAGVGVTDDRHGAEAEDAGVDDRLLGGVDGGGQVEAVGGEAQGHHGRLRLHDAGDAHDAATGHRPVAPRVGRRVHRQRQRRSCSRPTGSVRASCRPGRRTAARTARRRGRASRRRPC